MREAGGFLILVGVIAIIGAFFVTTSTHVGYVPSSTYLPSMPSDVVNLHGLHIQALVFQGGFAAIIAGSVLFGFGAIDETLNRNSGTLPKAAPPKAVPSESAPPETAPPEIGRLVFDPNYVVEDIPPDTVGRNLFFVGAGIFAVVVTIILMIISAQRSHSSGANAPLDTTYDANADMSMDTNMVMDTNAVSPPSPRR